MHEKERVLFVVPARAIAAGAARRVIATGSQAIVVASLEDAKRVEGTFDRGVFSFDLPDGSGIVFAAEMMLEGRIGYVEFFHPSEEAFACEHPSEVRSTSIAIEVDEPARIVA
jgi:hypothetical protein